VKNNNLNLYERDLTEPTTSDPAETIDGNFDQRFKVSNCLLGIPVFGAGNRQIWRTELLGFLQSGSSTVTSEDVTSDMMVGSRRQLSPRDEERRENYAGFRFGKMFVRMIPQARDGFPGRTASGTMNKILSSGCDDTSQNIKLFETVLYRLSK
jgi:hypothetical protein